MKHSLISKESSEEDVAYEITVMELDSQTVNISILVEHFISEHKSHQSCINLNKKELHSLIGTLLHVQAKMKGGSNG